MKFTPEQLVFICRCIIAAGIDRAITGLEAGYNDYLEGARETTGMALATFYAQFTGDGMAIVDALALLPAFDEAVEMGDTSLAPEMAQKFVEAAFLPIPSWRQ